MEKKDEELIKTLLADDAQLKEFYEEHVALEKKLDELNKRVYLTAEQELERKQLQKKKLAGKDRIMEILDRHRGTSATA